MDETNHPLADWLLQSWAQDGAEVPAFPSMAIRLVDAIESPDVDVESVEEIISQDASITSQVIRTANSALYGSVCEVAGLHQAIMRIGFRETANVALMAASRALYDVEDRAELSCFPTLWSKLWLGSLVGAFGARLLARELKLGDPSSVFMCALFRDVGCLLIAKLLAAGLVRGRLRDKPDDDSLDRLLEELHTRLGGEYLRQNHMPEHVIEVAERHHHLDLPFAHDTIPLHLVRCADGLCEQVCRTPSVSEAGEAEAPLDAMPPAALESASALGIDDDRLVYFALQFEAVREQVSELMVGPMANGAG